MAKVIGKRKEKEEEKLKCVKCGFEKAECLEYTPEGLMCQNCIFLRLSEKERDAKNLSDLIGKMEEEGDVDETYEGTVSPVKGFTVLLTSEDVLMQEIA
jgi:late competence protein required for DNA uptake (superfamily II DNA/RNA helicase)